MLPLPHHTWLWWTSDDLVCVTACRTAYIVWAVRLEKLTSMSVRGCVQENWIRDFCVGVSVGVSVRCLSVTAALVWRLLHDDYSCAWRTPSHSYNSSKQRKDTYQLWYTLVRGYCKVCTRRVWRMYHHSVPQVTSAGPRAYLANKGKDTYIHQPSNIAENSNMTLECESCIIYVNSQFE